MVNFEFSKSVFYYKSHVLLTLYLEACTLFSKIRPNFCRSHAMSIYKTQQFHLTTVDFVVLKDFLINVVGMSIEKMWRNDEMTNFGIFTQPIPMFFLKYKLRQPRQCRDSCTYYVIFQNFVISSFRHIFSIDMPTT